MNAAYMINIRRKRCKKLLHYVWLIKHCPLRLGMYLLCCGTITSLRA